MREHPITLDGEETGEATISNGEFSFTNLVGMTTPPAEQTSYRTRGFIRYIRNDELVKNKAIEVRITYIPSGPQPEIVSEDIENGELYNGDYFANGKTFTVSNMQSGDVITLSTDAPLTLTENAGVYTITGTNNTNNTESVDIVLNGTTVLCEFYVLPASVENYTFTWATAGGKTYPFYRQDRNMFAGMLSVYDNALNNVTYEMSEETSTGIYALVKDGNTTVVNTVLECTQGTNPNAHFTTADRETVQDYITNNQLTQAQIEAMTVTVGFVKSFRQYTDTQNINYYAS